MSDAVLGHLFDRDGDRFVPTRLARGYWQKGTLSGMAAASLLGRAIARRAIEPGWVPVRLSVDMLRMPPDAPLTVAVDLLHDSRRLRLVEARVLDGDTVVTRALCQIVRTGSQPEGQVWQSPPWPAPHPDSLPAGIQWARWDLRAVPGDDPRFVRHAPAGDAPVTGNPPVLGPLAPVGARQAWIGPRIAIVANEPVSPWEALVLTADFASPLTHSSEHGIDFVNTDFTVHVHRLPEGGWIGFEMVGHSSSAGVAVGHAAIHDVTGPLGSVVVSAIANSRRG